MSESYTASAPSYYGGPSELAGSCKVCGRLAGPSRYCRRCLVAEPQFGPGYTDRGERAARAYRYARDTLAHIHPYSHSYESHAWEVRTAKAVMRAYGFGLDDERGE